MRKRSRSTSLSTSSCSSSPAAVDNYKPTNKAVRILNSATSRLTCTLPPTCHERPTYLQSPRDLEAHYTSHHQHVCEHEGCNKIFPDARFLELHFAECHDPLVELRKARGEKTFRCFQFGEPEACKRVFDTPKHRRMHLVDVHGYPDQFFFAITNKGLGEMFRRWGDGASLVRGEWKPREPASSSPLERKLDETLQDNPSSHTAIAASHHERLREAPPHLLSGANKTGQPIKAPVQAAKSTPQHSPDDLASAMDSLSLVPRTIRFGRGGKKGGFVRSMKNERSVITPDPCNS